MRRESFMSTVIERGSAKYISDCVEALECSELGRRYFAREGSAEQAIREGLDQGTLYVALRDGSCVGFIWYLPKGAFHSFPYIHIVAVKAALRGSGVGRALMEHVEALAFQSANKVFLVVADFNPSAKRFYERNGYLQVGEIAGLYRDGIAEYIMMKERPSE